MNTENDTFLPVRIPYHDHDMEAYDHHDESCKACKLALNDSIERLEKLLSVIELKG